MNLPAETIAEALGLGQADLIREHAFRHFVLPAIERGETELTIRSGDIVSQLKLHQAAPNVCSALEGSKFLKGVGLNITSREGPPKGTTTTFGYTIDEPTELSNDQAANLMIMILGQPENNGDTALSWTLADGRAIALQTDIPSAQIWTEMMKEPPFSLKHRTYLDSVGRHSGLPGRLSGQPPAELASKGFPHSIVRIEAITRRELVEALDWYFFSPPAFNPSELADMKASFLALYPDFEGLTFAADKGGYFEDERSYKQALIDQAQSLMAKSPGLSRAQLGGALLDLLAGKEAGLLGWRTDARIKTLRQNHPGILEDAAATLASFDQAPAKTVGRFVKDTWRALEAGQKSKPYSESRNLPSMLLALLKPDIAVGINTTPMWSAGKRLLGKNLYGNNPLSESEYAGVLEFAKSLQKIMQDEWGWKPRDLWDVQGFLWAVSRKDSQQMSNDDILKHFDVNTKFMDARQAWSNEQTDAFVSIARSAHEVGLDWWFIGKSPYELRFGRKRKDAVDATAVQGYLAQYANAPYFSQNTAAHCLELDVEEGPIGQGQAQAFQSAIEAAAEEISDWYQPEPPRAGLWPDESIDEMSNEPKKSPNANSQNIILYGPPGTGKTFSTTAKAIELIDGKQNQSSDEAKRRYDQLMAAGQIRFVTFHQSYSYEDFVEGLRPQTDASGEEGEQASGGFRLEPRDGIFREISKLAEQAAKTTAAEEHLNLQGRQFFKMSLGRAGAEDHIYDAAIEGNYIVLGWGGDVDWSDPKFEDYQEIHDKWNQIEPGTSGNAGNISQVWRFRSTMQIGDIVIASEGNSKFRAIGVVTSDYFFDPTDVRTYNHKRKVDWLVVLDEALAVETIYDGAFTMQSCYPLKEGKVKKEGLARLLSGQKEGVNENPDQFVLIIDEINRANISKVFGELITLLEPDKRLGSKNELKVKLPYSGDTFGVPSNLHVIGTMNTADRSIALLDTALRRRFRFEELMPKPDLLSSDIEGIDVTALLQSLNNRIEYLFDRDHQIGHAYFWDCASKKDIDDIMRNKIIPLLCEYFYEDWERVRQALNETEGEGAFVVRTKLKPPSAENDQFGSERFRYTVRSEFAASAYDQLK